MAPPPPPLTVDALRSGALTTQTLLLDSQIRDWVVLPLLVLMIAAGLLRSHVGRLLRPPPKPVPRVDARARSAITRCARLKGPSGRFLPGSRWEFRRLAWSAREAAGSDALGGWLRQEAVQAESDKLELERQKAENGDANGGDVQGVSATGLPPGMDPATMMEGMKGNMAAMVQNMVMMQGISHFFRGFVLVRVPFPLTRGFKQMFQRGLFDLTTLDTSYVSSVSWYFLVMFGLRAFFRLAMGDPLQEEVEGGEIQRELGLDYGGGGGAPGNQFDAAKALQGEADNLELLAASLHRSNIDEAEKKLLGKRYPRRNKKKIGGKGNGDDVLFGLTSGSGKSKGSYSSKKKSA